MGRKWRYGVIIDAGSSGSRVHVYRWKDAYRVIEDAATSGKDLHHLPTIKTKWTKKIRPGISSFGDKPQQVGVDHLQPLIDYALQVVPEEMLFDTPIYVMATAGMRLLSQKQQDAIVRQTCSYLAENTGFRMSSCADNVQVISGETEGLFGWLAANYLLGGFDRPAEHAHGQNHHTYGFLDMGGASAQIAFAPNTTEAVEHAKNLKLVRLRTLDGTPEEFRVFTASWLGFGVNQARQSYVTALTSQHGDLLAQGGAIPDPCMPKGLRTTLDGTIVGSDTAAAAAAVGKRRGDIPTLLGTGDFTSCLVASRPLLAKDHPCGEGSGPCLIHDPVPSIDFNVNRFVGVSEYYHSTHGFFGEKGDHAYDFAAYQANVLAFCDQDWSSIAADITARKKTDERKLQDAQQACFKASWVINVLHEGIGIPRVGLDRVPGLNVSHEALERAKKQGFASSFRPVDTIDDVEVSWTLGRMLLYAAEQVPPADASREAAVGFGSNTADGSTPDDFTYAGSDWSRLRLGSGGGDSGSGSDEDDAWGDPDGLLGQARRRPTSSGLLLFAVAVVAVVVLLLRKRERRARLAGRCSALLRRSRRPGSPRKAGRVFSSLANTLFGRRSREYDRVLEEGRLAFELGDMDSADDGENENESSDSSEGTGGSRTSATQRLARTSGLATPQRPGDLHDDGRTGSAMDRSGLVVRTESRERLTSSLMMLNAGRRSRAASPTRLKSPMMSPLSED